MRLGWWTPWVDSLKLSALAYTRIENAYKVRKETFGFAVFMWLLYVQLLRTSGDKTDTRLCEPL